MGGARSKRSSADGDRVIESRHLIGVFFAVVVLCGVFFTLGYVMGRTEHEPAVSLAAPPKDAASATREPKGAQNGGGVVPAPTDWDFYPQSGKAAKPAAPVTSSTPSATPGNSGPPAGTTASSPAASDASRSAPAPPARFNPPLIPRGAFLLQVAALVHEGDALALADALQQRRFPAYVLTPTADNLYRVQVGPYADSKSAELAKHSLEREGFKTILKR